MSYDEAKAEVLAALWLPEVGQRCCLHFNRRRIMIIVHGVPVKRGQKFPAYEQHKSIKRHYFTLAEWWRHTSTGCVTPVPLTNDDLR